MSVELRIVLPDEQLERLAERAAELLAERQTPAARDGWLRGADRIAQYIDCPRSRVYALTSAGRIPVERDGSNLIARKSALDQWVRDGGGVRP
jgi:excisionase family DNA binding protein